MKKNIFKIIFIVFFIILNINLTYGETKTISINLKKKLNLISVISNLKVKDLDLQGCNIGEYKRGKYRGKKAVYGVIGRKFIIEPSNVEESILTPDMGIFIYVDNDCTLNYKYETNGIGKNCGIDKYKYLGYCKGVGIGYYSPENNNNRLSCTNKDPNGDYISSGNGGDDCEWNCKEKYHKYLNKCLSNKKEVLCIENGKPLNSHYNTSNVMVTWNINTNKWSRASSCTWSCNDGYKKIDDTCVEKEKKKDIMELVYNGIVEGDTIDLAFKGNVNLTNIDWGVGGENCMKNFSGINLKIGRTTNLVTCTYTSGGTKIIKIKGRATGFGKYISKGIEKLKAVNSWGDMGFQELSRAFSNAEILEKVPDELPKNVVDIKYMFQRTKFFNYPLNSWNTNKIINMHGMFFSAEKFNQSLNSWDTSKVIDMGRMFYNTGKFNKNIKFWDTSEVKNMNNMFNSAKKFNQNLNCWNVENIGEKPNRFDENSLLIEENLPKWGTTGTGNCENIGTMELVYELDEESKKTIELPFKGDVNLEEINWGVGGENCMKTFSGLDLKVGRTTNLVICNYTSLGTKTIKIKGKATGFGKNDKDGVRGIDKLKAVNSWENMGFKDLSYAFFQAKKITKVPSILPENIINMNGMFILAENFNQALDSWDVSNVQNMNWMFFKAEKFNQPLDSWDVSNVTDMKSMFAFAKSFNQPLDSWNINKNKNISYMFYKAKNFNQSLDSWDVSNIINMEGTFNGAENFNQPLDSWDVSNVTSMEGMFDGANNFNQNLNCWNVSKVIKNKNFNKNSGISEENLPKWGTTGTGNCENIGTMELVYNGLISGDVVELPFKGTIDIKDVDCGKGGIWDGNKIPIYDWYYEILNVKCTYNSLVDSGDTIIKIKGKSTGFGKMSYPLVKGIEKLKIVKSWENMGFTNLSRAFHKAENLIKVPNYLPKNVTNISYMFRGAENFNQPLNSWNVSNVIDMTDMFDGADNFNQPLNSWDVSNVKNMSAMFAGADNFNQPLNSWDVSNVTDISGMFYIAEKFNQSLNSWNLSNVKNMTAMFAGAENFNQPLNSWDVSNVINMRDMFYGAENFNQPLDSWDVSNVTSMEGMFDGANNFNQNLNCWNVSKVIKNKNFNKNSGISEENLPKWGTSGILNCK